MGMDDFLHKISRLNPSSYGHEVYRTVLREIYRNGNISLRLLSYSVKVPVRELLPIINVLTEKGLISRIPEGILYTGEGMPYIESEFKLYGFGLDECELCEGAPIYVTPRWEGITEILDDLREKGLLDERLGNTETLTLQAVFLYDAGALEGKDVCFLLNTAELGIASSLIYKGIFPGEVNGITESAVINTFGYYILKTRAEEEEKRGNGDIIGEILSNVLNRSIAGGGGCRDNSDNDFKKILEDPRIPGKDIESISWDLLDEDNCADKILSETFDTIVARIGESYTAFNAVLLRSIRLLKDAGSEIYLFMPELPPEKMLQCQTALNEYGLIISKKVENTVKYFILEETFDINNEVLFILQATPQTMKIKESLQAFPKRTVARIIREKRDIILRPKDLEMLSDTQDSEKTGGFISGNADDKVSVLNEIYHQLLLLNERIPIEIFWCESCFKSIAVGPYEWCNVRNKESLTNGSCPYCGASLGFATDETEEKSVDPRKILKLFKDDD